MNAKSPYSGDFSTFPSYSIIGSKTVRSGLIVDKYQCIVLEVILLGIEMLFYHFFLCSETLLPDADRTRRGSGSF